MSCGTEYLTNIFSKAAKSKNNKWKEEARESRKEIKISKEEGEER
jgi:hypothetical protein